MSRFPNTTEGQGGQSMTEQVKEKASDIAEKVKDTATEQYQNLREGAQQYYEQGKEKAMQWEQTLEESVRDRPMRSLLIAAGVGMLLGVLWRRS